jgi:E3 ubiquitin-protein ligase BIG BROTHER-like protein
MDDSKGSGGVGGGDKPSAELPNPSPNPPPSAAAAAAAGDDGAAAAAAAAAAEDARRPFTALSQEEADLALARVLQEQVSGGEISRPRGSLLGFLDPP